LRLEKYFLSCYGIEHIELDKPSSFYKNMSKPKGNLTMKNTHKLMSLAVSLLMTGGLLGACAPNTNQPAAPATTPGSPATPVTENNSQTGGTVQTQSRASVELQSAMQAVVADEVTFSDSQSATSDSFRTQALEIEQRGEVSATSFLNVDAEVEAEAETSSENTRPTLRETVSTDVRPAPIAVRPAAQAAQAARRELAAQTRQRAEAQAQARKDLAMRQRAALQASGSMTVNADGTVTVDPARLRAAVKNAVEMRREQFLQIKTERREALQNRKELAQAKVQQLRRKNNVVRTSETQEVTNADGSITKIVTVEFHNERTGVKRLVTRSETSLNGRMVSGYYELEATGPNGYSRMVTRSVERLADGGRKVVTTSKTTWGNGRIRERSEERITGANGGATGSGTVSMTQADGTQTTYNYTIGVTASGEVSVEAEATAADSDLTVTVFDAAASEDVVVVVEEDGLATEVTVDLSADTDIVDADASAEAAV